MIFKTSPMFWDDNERSGYRHISVEYNERVLLAVVSHRTDGVWKSSVVPMGFNFFHDEVQQFANMFSVLPEFMKFLIKDELSFEDIQTYILTIQDKVDTI